MSEKEIEIEPEFFVVVFNDDFEISHATGFENYPRIADLFYMVKEMNKTDELSSDILLQRLDILTKEEFTNIQNQKEI